MLPAAAMPGPVPERAVAPVRERLAGWLAVLRLQPFDERTAQGRAQERHRRAALSALAAALSKALSVLATLVSIPLALAYLGAERFGVWSTLSALVLALQFADLGLGNGVVNAVSSAFGARDQAALRRYVSSAAFALLGVCLALGMLAWAVVPGVAWASVFNLQGALARAEVLPAVAVFAGCAWTPAPCVLPPGCRGKRVILRWRPTASGW